MKEEEIIALIAAVDPEADAETWPAFKEMFVACGLTLREDADGHGYWYGDHESLYRLAIEAAAMAMPASKEEAKALWENFPF